MKKIYVILFILFSIALLAIPAWSRDIVPTKKASTYTSEVLFKHVYNEGPVITFLSRDFSSRLVWPQLTLVKIGLILRIGLLIFFSVSLSMAGDHNLVARTAQLIHTRQH